MDLLIIGIIIIAAGFFIIRNIVKKIQGQSNCSCGSNCSECSNIHDKDLF